ncbi:MAG: Uncharacterised protein [Formosa sp. Hel3_A1_48]|nr:MAG: Uncharacterised protein [Formosa sp. Hel3_A1_48]
MNKKITELSQSIKKAKKTESNYRLPITIINKSSVGFMKAEVAAKDEGTPSSGDETVATAYFGSIPAGQKQTEYVNLPGGIEFVIWKIQPDFGEEIYGFGAANNAGGVDLTITD